MERLPFEVRLKVFQSLAPHDKFTCLFVSKDWHKVVNHCLYNDVKIQNTPNLTHAIAYFDKYPEIANGVMTIEIKSCDNALMSLPQIKQVFVNLKKLDFSCREDIQLQYPPENTCVSGTWDSLEELYISEKITVSRPSMVGLTLSQFFPNLTRLSLHFHHNSDKQQLTGDLDMMQNIPQLSQLEITSLNGLLLDVDALHRHTPKLKSLRLSRIDAILPKRSTGTVQLDHLSFQFDTELDTGGVISNFDYIVQKYVKLKSLSVTKGPVNFIANNGLSTTTTEFERTILPLFSHCPGLIFYDQMYFPLTPSIVNEMDCSGIQLNKIKLYTDQNNVENQCVALCNSQQIQSINHICLQPQLHDFLLFGGNSLNTRIIRKALISLVGLNYLTNLTIESYGDRICLTSITSFLNLMPQLLKISVHGMANTASSIEGGFENVATNLAVKSIGMYDLKDEALENFRDINMVMRELLPHCPYLEEFVLHMEITPSERPVCMTLDFRKNLNLMSIDIDIKEALFYYHLSQTNLPNTGNKRNQYYISQDATASTGYYLYDKEASKMMKKDYLKPGEYYTRLLLYQPAMLNSCQV